MPTPPRRRFMGRALLATLALTGFTMPSHATEEPDYRVIRQLAGIELREMPPSRVAAIRFSGFWSASNYDEHLALLQAALRDAGLAWEAEPVYSRYDAPFTPWFLRRNEIWLRLP